MKNYEADKVKKIRDEMKAQRPRGKEVERLREALDRITDRITIWCDAYPIDVFPEPDLAKCRELLGDAEFTRLNAHAMRHVVNSIAALLEMAQKEEG